MNLDLALLPATCDVLVIGAGPSGSAAAATLARAGLDVVMVDQHAFPRDKICGDGLIPDAHRALKRLGVLDEVMALAHPATLVGCTGPRGGRVEVPGTLAVLPRKVLDEILCRAAVAAGVRMFAPVRFVAPLEEGASAAASEATVVGARLQHGGEVREVRARWLLLATGAVPQGLLAAGMSSRHTPSGVALRGYVRNDAMVGRIDKLEIVWHGAIAPGYGWIFPCPDGVFNIGVGIADSHSQRRGEKLTKHEVNLRHVMDEFIRVHPPAAALMKGGTPLGPMKGAPLRCSLDGARFTRPGLLVIGEAAGSTYSFTGEGIGKALETGLLAADALRAERGNADAARVDAAVRSAYEAALLALRPRFALYEKANLVNRFPWLTELVMWRAKSSPRLIRRMSGILDETANPGNLFSVRGVMRLFSR